MESADFKLEWKKFGSNAPKVFQHLWQSKDFADVTLVSLDNRYILANRFMLSFSSPFFRDILKLTPQKNPLLYLGSIRYKILELILEYIYVGECYMAHDDLKEFLVTGKYLQVTGLFEDSDGNEQLSILPHVKTNNTIEVVSCKVD